MAFDSFKNRESELIGGDVFNSCPNCGSTDLADTWYGGSAGHASVTCRSCRHEFKRRGAIEGLLDNQMDKLQAGLRRQGKRNRQFIWNNPFVLVIFMAWFIGLSFWAGIQVNPDPGMGIARRVLGSMFGTIIGTSFLAVPGLLTMTWLRRRANPGESWRTAFVARQQTAMVIGALCLGLTAWRIFG